MSIALHLFSCLRITYAKLIQCKVLIYVAMGKQQKMQSFFKRKRDEEVAEHTSAPDALALVVFVHQEQYEAGQENHMQDEEEQENPISQDEEEEEQQASKAAKNRRGFL